MLNNVYEVTPALRKEGQVILKSIDRKSRRAIRRAAKQLARELGKSK